MRLGPSLRAVITALALLLQLGFALAFDDSSLVSAEREAIGMRSDLERVQGVIAQDGVTDEQLAEQRTIIERLRLDAVAEVEKINVPLEDVKQQLNQLGPAPATGQTEADTITKQRVSLADAVARFTAAKKQFELLGLEADQMSSKVSSQQRTQFFQRIFRADKSILNPQLWKDTATGLGLLSTRVDGLLKTWWQSQSSQIRWSGLALVVALIALIWAFYRIGAARFDSWLGGGGLVDVQASPLRRLWRVIFGAVLLIVGALLFSILLEVSLQVANLSTPRFELLISAFLGVFVACVFNTGIAYLICAPGQPGLRLIAIDNASARSIPLFVFAASLVQSVTAQISGLSDQLLLPVSLLAGQSALATAILIGLAGLLLLVLRRQSQAAVVGVPEPHYLKWFVSLMPVLWLLLAISILGLIFGYLALSYFIASKILDTVLVVVMIVLLHHLIDAFADTLQNPASQLGQKLRSFVTFGDRGIARLSLTFRTIADILLVVLGVPWLFALWTVTWVDFRSLVISAMLGFRVGNVTISPFNIVGLIGILALGVVATRFVTRWLDRRILSQTRLNKGVQDSVRTGANYFGYVLAAAFALSAAGFDFSSIAIVAGALGVGIGFGLQSIVNNFVSGLILLAERPIRVGDWVAINDGEGIVKKINVRSTEIETFDNCTIIVPNSTFITGSVRNWTHRDTLGRFLVSIGVAYGNDADSVFKILNDIVAAHPKVLRYPPPAVQLAKFAAPAMEFEVRGHVADVFDGGQVASDLRFAIVKAFREANIVLPLVQELVIKKNDK